MILALVRSDPPFRCCASRSLAPRHPTTRIRILFVSGYAPSLQVKSTSRNRRAAVLSHLQHPADTPVSHSHLVRPRISHRTTRRAKRAVVPSPSQRPCRATVVCRARQPLSLSPGGACCKAAGDWGRSQRPRGRPDDGSVPASFTATPDRRATHKVSGTRVMVFLHLQIAAARNGCHSRARVAHMMVCTFAHKRVRVIHSHTCACM